MEAISFHALNLNFSQGKDFISQKRFFRFFSSLNQLRKKKFQLKKEIKSYEASKIKIIRI